MIASHVGLLFHVVAGEQVLVLGIEKKDSFFFFEVQALASTQDLTTIQGWIRKTHLQPLDSTSAAQSGHPALIIGNLDLVGRARMHKPGKLRLQVGTGPWEPLTLALISDFQLNTPRYFRNEAVTTSAGEVHTEGRWIFRRDGQNGKLAVSKTNVHLIDEEKFPRSFRRRGLGRPCMTCGQRIRHYSIIGGGLGYIPQKSNSSKNSSQSWIIPTRKRSSAVSNAYSPVAVESDAIEEADAELVSASSRSETFPVSPDQRSKQISVMHDGNSNLHLLQVRFTGQFRMVHLAGCY